MQEALSILKKYYGFEQFRPEQADIVNAIAAGKDCLGLLPTGGGKSICFQVPALMREGLCIVVTPLVALMKDQVRQLKERNIAAEAIFSGLKFAEIENILDDAVNGNIKFLYVSPERLKTINFKERIKSLGIEVDVNVDDK